MNSPLIHSLQHAAPEILPGYPVLFAYVYGSYATGCANAFSDLDIGVYLHPGSTHHSLEVELDLALELDRSLGHKVETEVRAINSLPLMFLGRIVTDGILLYSRDESARVEFEVGVRKRYFDFLPVIREYHRTYIKTATK